MNNYIAKVKENGLKKSIRMFSVKLKKCEKKEAKHLSDGRKEAINSIMGKGFETIIIFENHFGYYNILQQRPQHIARELCDKETLVLYNSYYDVDYSASSRITRIKENCYVLDMYYYRKAVLELLGRADIKKFLMVYSTDTVPVARIKKYKKEGFRILYEYVDDINPDLIASKKLDMVKDRHKYLLWDKETLVVATADKLYKNVLQSNAGANVALISNGVECRKFPPTAKTKDSEYLAWLKEECIKVGYYGTMASWVDYQLLEELVSDLNIQLILIGIEYDASLRESGLLKHENVRYFGKKSYERLAGYANFFDVCIIPFVVNEITEATSPVKLFEYMSMGKPVVTTPLPECMKYDTVSIGRNSKDFKNKIYEAVEKKADREYIEALKNCATDNDWAAKANEMKMFILRENGDEGQAE